MSDQRDQQKQKGGQGGQQQGGGGQKSDQQRQQPNQKPGQGGQQQGGSAHMATDQISFYDESLKKQVEGTFTSDGKSIHLRSAYGNKSVPYSDLGACIDHNSQVLLAQKLLSELARDPGSGKFKDLHQQKDDQQLEPMQKPFVGGASGWGSWN
jgi:hypothetical protein